MTEKVRKLRELSNTTSIVLTDEDLKLMCSVFESKNRTPIEILKKKFVEFNRLLPS